MIMNGGRGERKTAQRPTTAHYHHHHPITQRRPWQTTLVWRWPLWGPIAPIWSPRHGVPPNPPNPLHYPHSMAPKHVLSWGDQEDPSEEVRRCCRSLGHTTATMHAPLSAWTSTSCLLPKPCSSSIPPAKMLFSWTWTTDEAKDQAEALKSSKAVAPHRRSGLPGETQGHLLPSLRQVLGYQFALGTADGANGVYIWHASLSSGWFPARPVI